MDFCRSEWDEDRRKLYSRASVLALITVWYNMIEGLVSVFFGAHDEAISLFGFGMDSFVEVVSGVGIWHMIKRLRQGGDENPDRFEQQALRITGVAFYLLTAGLTGVALLNLFGGHRPETTFWGIVVSVVSIVSMAFLIHAKVKVGKSLHSEAILADAACTKVCVQLSVVLLIASIGYELTRMGGLDSVGAIVIGLLSFREGKESFEKARNKGICTCVSACHSSIADNEPKRCIK